MSMPNNEYATKDLHLAAFLNLKGCKIARLDVTDQFIGGRRQVFFVFDSRGKCESLEAMFWDGKGDELMVDVKQYISFVRDLRVRVFTASKTNQHEHSNKRNNI